MAEAAPHGIYVGDKKKKRKRASSSVSSKPKTVFSKRNKTGATKHSGSINTGGP